MIQEILISQDTTMCKVYLFKSILKSYWDTKSTLKKSLLFSAERLETQNLKLSIRDKNYKVSSQESSQAVIMFCEMAPAGYKCLDSLSKGYS